MMGAGESGIPNVTVTLDGASTTLTDIDGRYFFATDVPGVHSIVESDLPGYFSTTPNEVHLGVSAGQSYEVNFGDANSNSNFAAILGTVFADLDGDGQWDSNELGIPNVTVHLDDSSTTTTNQYGSYGFITDVAGVHQVNEEDPANYFSTTPNEVHVAVAMGQGYQVDFGDAPNGSGFAAVYGTVFEDANSDGQWDDEEVGIAGVTVALDGETAVTNAYGNYTLGTSSAGNHTVVETDLPGYVSTTPNIVNVNVALNNGYQIDFGDISNITCSPDSYEEDDTKNQAGSIIVNEAAQTHNFCEDATDWTTFTAEAGTVYTITTSAWGQRADTFLSLYDVNGTTMLLANDDYEGTTDYSSRIIWEATADGTYYVRTTNRAGLTQGLTEYDLSIEATIINEVESPFIYMPIIFNSWSNDQAAAVKEVKLSKPRAPEGEINHFCPDAYETDDTWQEALAVADGDVQVHSFDSNPALYAADKDFVSVDLAAGQTVTFTITAASNTETLLELYDENGDAMDVDDLTDLSWTAETAGHYYASVSPLNSMNFGCTNTVSYELTVAVSGEVPSPPMIFLPFVSKG
jgi:hypothetical protein